MFAARQAAPDPAMTAAGEWARHWPLVLASVAGVSLASSAIYGLGQFLGPLESAFGWGRTQVMAGISASSFASFLLFGVIGRIIDTTSARLIAIAGVLLTMASIAGFSLVGGSYPAWLFLWIVSAIGGIMTSPIVWIAAINGAFDKGRSLAAAVVLSGTGISMTLGPGVARYLIDGFGWQHAFQLLALIWGGISLIMTVLFFHDSRPVGAKAQASEAAAPERTALLGLLLSGRFIRFAIAVFGVILVFSALVINLAPVLVEGGLSRAGAAWVAGFAGLASIAGKLLTGSLFDRAHLAVVTTGAMAMMGLSCFLLNIADSSTVLATAACFAMGLASGSMVTFMACASARIFKPEDFGTAYGALLSVMGLASIVGPVLAGLVFDRFRSYDPLVWSGVAVAVVAALLLASLAPRTSEAERSSPDHAMGEPQ